MTVLDLSRWQFGIATVYYFLFVPLTIGLSLVFRKRLTRTDIVPARPAPPPVTGPESVEPVGGRP